MEDVFKKLEDITTKVDSIKELLEDDNVSDSWIESSLDNCISELEDALYYLNNNIPDKYSSDAYTDDFFPDNV